MQRREFLAGAAAVAGLARVRSVGAQTSTQAKLDRISIMTLNFQRILRLPEMPADPLRTLELFDIGTMLADTYGTHKVEFQHYHIPSTETSYLRDLRASVEKSKSRITQINLEFAAQTISADNPVLRMQAIDLTKRWVDHAVVLGAQRVMANQGALTQANKGVAIEALKIMTDYGRSKGIIVSLETRGAPGAARGRAGEPPPAPAAPAEPAWKLLAEVIKAGNSYSNVDVGGAAAADQAELHDCLRTMFPFTANTMHTRVNTRWDLATAIKFLNGLGYKGLYTIEVNNGHEGIKPVFDIVMANI